MTRMIKKTNHTYTNSKCSCFSEPEIIFAPNVLFYLTLHSAFAAPHGKLRDKSAADTSHLYGIFVFLMIELVDYTFRSKTSEYKKKKIHLIIRIHIYCCEVCQSLEQVAQRGCGFSILWDVWNLTGHGPGQLADLALSRGLDQAISRGPSSLKYSVNVQWNV